MSPVPPSPARTRPLESSPSRERWVVVCSWCGRLHDGDGAWAPGRAPGDAHVSHGICQACFDRVRAEGG